MRKIVSSFTSDTGLNDALVHGFVCRLRNWPNVSLLLLLLLLLVLFLYRVVCFGA